MDNRRAGRPLHYGLDVWKDSMRLTREIYHVSATFPDSERFGLVARIRRCAVSAHRTSLKALAAVESASTRIICASQGGR